MRKSLIISRFNQNISWLDEIKDFKIIIYNKGEKLSNKKFKNIVNLNNVGRESHTWLHHIVENYKDLNFNNQIWIESITKLCKKKSIKDVVIFSDSNITNKFVNKLKNRELNVFIPDAQDNANFLVRRLLLYFVSLIYFTLGE